MQPNIIEYNNYISCLKAIWLFYLGHDIANSYNTSSTNSVPERFNSSIFGAK